MSLRASFLCFVLPVLLSLTGCGSLSGSHASHINEECTVMPATREHMLVVSEPMKWSASEHGRRYHLQLPTGTYSVVARNADYWFYQAPEPLALGDTKMFSSQDHRAYDGGIFISKNPRSPHSSGAYIDSPTGKKLLIFIFDSHFTRQEGDRWHYVD